MAGIKVTDRERFSRIMKEYGYQERMIKLLWDRQPDEYKLSGIDEESLRRVAVEMAPLMAKPTNLN